LKDTAFGPWDREAGVGDVDWGRLFSESLRDVDDIVELATAIRERSDDRSAQFAGAAELRKQRGLSINELGQVLAWLKGKREDDELRAWVAGHPYDRWALPRFMNDPNDPDGAQVSKIYDPAVERELAQASLDRFPAFNSVSLDWRDGTYAARLPCGDEAEFARALGELLLDHERDGRSVVVFWDTGYIPAVRMPAGVARRRAVELWDVPVVTLWLYPVGSRVLVECTLGDWVTAGIIPADGDMHA